MPSEQQDNRSHILLCTFSKKINEGVLQVMKTCTENKANVTDIEIIYLDIPTSLQLPTLFTFSEVLQQVHERRQKKQKMNVKKLVRKQRQ